MAAAGHSDDGRRRARRAAALWAGLCGLLLALELGSHLALPAWPYYRGWNVAHRDSGPFEEVATPGPFFPLVRWEGTCTGDLSFLARVPALDVPRSQRFTTDALGYRNEPGREHGPWEVVVFGDSVMAGSGSSDEDTFAARLEDELGVPVYSAAGKDASVVLAEPRWVRDPPRVVVLECVERFLAFDAAAARLGELRPGSLEPSALAASPPPRRARGRWSPAYSAATRYGGFAWCTTLWALFDELDTPEVLLGTDGRTLFSTDELVHGALPLAALGLERFADSVAAAHAALAEHGIELVFLLAPDKATLRRDLLPPAVARAMRPPEALARALGAALAERGVRSVDVLGALVRARDEAGGTAEPLYWPDDTHWSPRGTRVAAAEAARRIGR